VGLWGVLVVGWGAGVRCGGVRWGDSGGRGGMGV